MLALALAGCANADDSTTEPAATTTEAAAESEPASEESTAKGEPVTEEPSAEPVAGPQLDDYQACALIDDISWRTFWETDGPATSAGFLDAAADLTSAAPTAASSYFKTVLEQFSEVATTIAGTLEKRENGEDVGLFFPSEPWDEMFDAELRDACDAAGYEWREE